MSGSRYPRPDSLIARARSQSGCAPNSGQVQERALPSRLDRRLPSGAPLQRPAYQVVKDRLYDVSASLYLPGLIEPRKCSFRQKPS